MDAVKYILAIDLGTSGPKVALVSTAGEILDFEFEKTPFFLTPNGGAEQNPDDWWQAIVKATRRLLGKKPVSIPAIVAISCTAQWSGTVPVDQKGQAITNAIIWMDSRGVKQVKKLMAGFPSINGYNVFKLMRWIHLTGGVPGLSGKDPIAHILYLKHEFPDFYNSTYKFLEPKDYINMRLTGKFVATYDSITLHWLTDNRDLTKINYNNKLIKIAGVEPEKLPELTRAIDIIGTIRHDVAVELGLGTKVQVIAGTPDVQSAAIGSGAVQDYQGHLYIGTSSWLTCHVPFKKTDLKHNIASLPSAIPQRYFVANTQESAGVCLNYLKDNLLCYNDNPHTNEEPFDIYELLDEIVAKTPAGSEKLIFTPWLYGERTPVEDSTIRGGFYNLSLNSTRNHMIRAVFEGVALNTKWLLKHVESFINRPFNSINMIGGGANSEVWCQIHADILERTIHQVKNPIQANIRGAAWLAAVALGHTTFDEISSKTQIANTFVPNPQNKKLYNRLFTEFIAIYKKNKTIYSRLNRGNNNGN